MNNTTLRDAVNTFKKYNPNCSMRIETDNGYSYAFKQLDFGDGGMQSPHVFLTAEFDDISVGNYVCIDMRSITAVRRVVEGMSTYLVHR